MKKTGKIFAICILAVTLSLTIGSVILGANQTTGMANNDNVVIALNDAKLAKQQAQKEATIYTQALKSMQLNYWIAFLTVLSLTFLGVMAVIMFVQSRKNMAVKVTDNVEQ